jgi:hypothetical protein
MLTWGWDDDLPQTRAITQCSCLCHGEAIEHDASLVGLIR